MKRFIVLMIGIALLMFSAIQAQDWGAQSLRHVYEKQATTTTIDGADTDADIVASFSLGDTQGGHGVSWGSFTLWFRADTLKADVSKADSISIWYQEIKCDGNQNSTSNYTTSSFDSTNVVTLFNWTSGLWKKYTITPDVCCGLEFHVHHETLKDDSIAVQLHIDYQ